MQQLLALWSLSGRARLLARPLLAPRLSARDGTALYFRFLVPKTTRTVTIARALPAVTAYKADVCEGLSAAPGGVRPRRWLLPDCSPCEGSFASHSSDVIRLTDVGQTSRRRVDSEVVFFSYPFLPVRRRILLVTTLLAVRDSASSRAHSQPVLLSAFCLFLIDFFY